MAFEQTPRRSSSVEKNANYEGNHTLLLVERLRNPTIRQQILDLHQRLLPHANNPDTFVDQRLDIDGDTKKALEITHIDNQMRPSGVCMDREIYINPSKPVQGSEHPPSNQQLSIVEAHEKGHLIRRVNVYNTGLYKAHFLAGFDTTKVTLSDGEYREFSATDDYSRTKDQVTKSLVDYLFGGAEIVERMSQLKNYFGMKGAEPFTKEYLAYAREHYVLDTGYDNSMTHFFQAITSETENKFIELMNTSGV